MFVNSRDFKDKVLEIKKKRFLDGVVRAAKSLGVHTPKVQFWEDKCPDDTGNEMAHIHLELALICVSEKRLREMDYDDIEDTATHEVTHLSDKTPEDNSNHSPDFYRRHDNVKVSSWRPEGAGVVVIDGGARTSKSKHKPEKRKIDKTVCNRYNFCEEKKGLRECSYCKDWYCSKHCIPFEPSLGHYAGDDSGHPCADYTDYKIKEREEQDRRYKENLTKVIRSEPIITNDSRKSYVEARMASDEPLHKRSFGRQIKYPKNETTSLPSNKPVRESKTSDKEAEEKAREWLDERKKQILEERDSKTYHSDYIDTSKNIYVYKKSENKFWNKIKCFFGFHQLEKLGGPVNYGDGDFMQKYVCKRCKKVIKRIS